MVQNAIEEGNKPISCRVSLKTYSDIENIAEGKKQKVGTWLRNIIPFIRNYPELTALDGHLLSTMRALMRNRNILFNTIGQNVSRQSLEARGYDFDLQTNSRFLNGVAIIEVMDCELHILKEDELEVKIKQGYGDV